MFQEKIFKNLQKKRLWEYIPPVLKIQKIEIKGKENKRKGKGKLYLLFTLYLI